MEACPAVARGHQPILAGRNREKHEAGELELGRSSDDSTRKWMPSAAAIFSISPADTFVRWGPQRTWSSSSESNCASHRQLRCSDLAVSPRPRQRERQGEHTSPRLAGRSLRRLLVRRLRLRPRAADGFGQTFHCEPEFLQTYRTKDVSTQVLPRVVPFRDLHTRPVAVWVWAARVMRRIGACGRVVSVQLESHLSLLVPLESQADRQPVCSHTSYSVIRTPFWARAI